MALQTLDLDAFRSTPLTKEPFDYLVVPGFVSQEVLAGINADYPEVAERGSFPVGQLTFGRAFEALVFNL
jgi:hypothetical protein